MEFPEFAKSIFPLSDSGCRFSICTLVSKPAEYAEMIASFFEAGFKPEFCEFLYCDNSQSNQLDAYSAYNLFLSAARGKYIILCHQDILLKFDGIDKLDQCIRELDSRDPSWALLGNGGGIGFGRCAVRITHPGNRQNTGRFPVRVESLDENFILVKRSANLCLSHDMKGFHFYGTDLCQNAISLGLTAWVVDFHLFHKSPGKLDGSFIEAFFAISRKYRGMRRNGYIQSTCALIPVGKSRWRWKCAVMILLQKLKKQENDPSNSRDIQTSLKQLMGGGSYALHLFLYKLAVPYHNLVRSVRKRLSVRD
ncbi:MAG: acyl esterase [Verrucomicrobiota bacterium]